MHLRGDSPQSMRFDASVGRTVLHCIPTFSTLTTANARRFGVNAFVVDLIPVLKS
jgi:hypothetical protein